MAIGFLVDILKSVAGKKAPNYHNNHVVYAIGDVHGYPDALEKILESVQSDFAKRKAAKPNLSAALVFTGDFVNRGPGAREVIETLCRQKMAQEQDGIQRVFLYGNHDYLTLKYLKEDDPVCRHKMIPDLINYGLLQTAASYGVYITTGNPQGDKNAITLKHKNAEVTPQNLEKFHRELVSAIPPHHLSLLKSLKVTHVDPRAPDFFFCHAGVDWTKPVTEQQKNVMLGIGTWEEQQLSRSFAKHANGAKDAIVVHGHTIMPEVDIFPGRISIDTGVYEKGGKLSCVVLSGTEVLDTLSAKSRLPPYNKKAIPKNSTNTGDIDQQNMSHPMDVRPQ